MGFMQFWRILFLAGFLVSVPSAANLFAGAAPAPKTPDAKEEEEVFEVDGLEIARADGKYLGLLVKENHFVLGFYDKDKKPEAVDMDRALLRWPVRYQSNDERTMLRAGGDGNSMTSAYFVRPPHSFRVYIYLYGAGSDEPAENYIVEYRGEGE